MLAATNSLDAPVLTILLAVKSENTYRPLVVWLVVLNVKLLLAAEPPFIVWPPALPANNTYCVWSSSNNPVNANPWSNVPPPVLDWWLCVALTKLAIVGVVNVLFVNVCTAVKVVIVSPLIWTVPVPLANRFKLILVSEPSTANEGELPTAELAILR